MLEINFHNKQQYFVVFSVEQNKKQRRENTTIIIISDLPKDFSYVTCLAHPGVT